MPSVRTCFVGEFCFWGKPEFPLSLMNNWCWGTRENLNHSTRFNMFNLKMDFTDKTWTMDFGEWVCLVPQKAEILQATLYAGNFSLC